MAKKVRDLIKQFDALKSAVQAFGGVVPASLRPMVQQMLAMSGLTADMKKQLTGMIGPPAWQVAAERAQALGVDPATLGAGFNQARISSKAFGLQHDIDMFKEFNANVDDFLPGVSDELSELAMDAIRTGAAIPKSMEEYFKKVSERGLLLDTDGNRIDMSALVFSAELKDEALDQVVKLLEDIYKVLSGNAGGTISPITLPVEAGGFGPRMPRQLDDAGLQMPSASGWQNYAGASYAGPGSGLDGSGMNVTINAIDASSFEQFLKQRGGAEAVVRSMPDVIERWRGSN